MKGKKKEPKNNDKILNATVELLESTSYSSLTVEGIASKAGVGKSTIYRWWENKAYLVLDAFLMMANLRFKFDSDKSLHENFNQNLQDLCAVLNSKVGISLLTIVTENEEIANVFYASYLSHWRTEAKKLLETEIKKGVVQPTIDSDVILDMIYGPIYLQILIYKKVPDEKYINELLIQVLKSISK